MPKPFCRGPLLLAAMLLTTVQAQLNQCNGGAQCITLKQCTGLFSQVKQARGNLNPQLIQLLRNLHCGFENNNDPKVCCPDLLYSQTGPNDKDSEGQGVFPSSSSNGDSFNSGTVLSPRRNQCGIQNSNRIVGGSSVEIDEHPWMALLRYEKPGGWGLHCGGVLISSRYVLTAAHCIRGKALPNNWRLTEVRLGEYNVSSQIDCVDGELCNTCPQDIPIERVIVHEGYDPNDEDQYDDIALIRLAKNADIGVFVSPICLPGYNLITADFAGYTNMEVVGWGKTETRESSDVKLKVKVPVVGRQECASLYHRVNKTVHTSQICAGGQPGKDSCSGDSGGPLMGPHGGRNAWVVVGVVSYGVTPCGLQGWPGVYTRVGAYVDWIRSKMQR